MADETTETTLKLATFRIDEGIWDAFREKAKSNKTNASALLKDFIGNYLDGGIDASRPAGDSRLDSKVSQLEEQLIELHERLGKLSAA